MLATNKAPLNRQLHRKELSLLGSLLEEFPSAPSPAVALLLRHAPASFDDLNHGRLASAIYTLWQSQRPVNAVTVAELLDGQKPLGDSTPLFLMGAASQASPMDLAELEAADVWRGYQARRGLSVLADAQNALAASPGSSEAILGAATRALDGLKIESAAITPFSSNGHGILPEIMEAAGFVTQSLPPPEPIVHGVLHKGCKMSLGGSSKAFKSWSFIHLALSVSHGLPWLSFPTTPSRVLYLNFELPDWACQQRINAVAGALNVAINPKCFYVWNLRGYATTFDVILPKIAERIGNGGYSLVILDPIYKIYGSSDENSATDIALLLNAVESVCRRTGSAVAYGAHFSKGNQAAKESIDRVSGSGVFARDPDTILTFTKHEEEECFCAEFTLRNHAPVNPFVVRWQYPLFVVDESLDPANIKQIGGRKPERRPEEILEVLGKRSLTTTEWQMLAKEELGISNGRFYELLREVKESGGAIKSVINSQWQKVLRK